MMATGGSTAVKDKPGKREKRAAAEAEEDGVETFYDAMKKDMAERAGRTKSALDALEPYQRVQMEGFRPGTYLRLRFKGGCPHLHASKIDAVGMACLAHTCHLTGRRWQKRTGLWASAQQFLGLTSRYYAGPDLQVNSTIGQEVLIAGKERCTTLGGAIATSHPPPDPPTYMSYPAANLPTVTACAHEKC